MIIQSVLNKLKYEAINIYLQLIETAPQDLVHYNNLGILYLQIAQLKKAEDIFRKASDLNILV